MNENLKSLAMIDIAEGILRDNKEPLDINELLNKVLEIKEYPLSDVDKKTQLYMDITQSGKFVYGGDDKWDLKERNLELWDKDGYAFVSHDVEEEADDDLDFTEFVLEDLDLENKAVDDSLDDDELDDVLDEEILEEAEYIEMELPTISTDDEDIDDPEIEFDDDYDEDDYNEIMDDYEDMYDDD